ncbi:MAG: hypothetical protein H6742_09835 [Alphaproteobacteria bacterium]|nr:hypothetical protein [Alphaproteobacteria bacterium]
MTASLPRLLLCWPAACGTPAPGGLSGDVQRYADAVALLPDDPRAAAAGCDAVVESELHGDCMVQAAAAMAPSDAARASALCTSLDGGLHRDECWFRVAEVRGDSALCGQAGAFADDCRLHVFSHALRALLPPGVSPASAEPLLATAIPGHGFTEDDPRPWSAAFRWVLGGQRPLDPATCDAVAESSRAEACRQTALAVYSDRLNHARDTGRFPCDADPGDLDALPESLRFAEDPALRALLEARRAQDLCP